MTYHRSFIASVLIFALIFGFFFNPQPAEARSIFQHLFQFLRWTSNFIVKTPGRIAEYLTRPLGPILGPIAAELLLANTPNRILEVISKAEKVKSGIDTYEQQKKKLNDARKILRDRATEVEKEMADLVKVKDRLERELLGGDKTYVEYRDNVIALDQMVAAYQETADRIRAAADNLRPENLLRQIAADAINASGHKIERLVTRRIGQEVESLINIDVINRFLGEGGLNPEKVIDLVITGDISRLLAERGHKKDADFDQIVGDIRDEIKQMLKNDRDFYQKNWRQVLDAKIKEILEKNKLKNQNINQAEDSNTNAAVDENNDLYLDDPSNIPLDENGCAPGYTHDRMVGKCFQINCGNGGVTNAHLGYTLDCVCGSSGSIEENVNDPNQECGFPPNYGPCPSCIYACVGLKDKCPQKPDRFP